MADARCLVHFIADRRRASKSPGRAALKEQVARFTRPGLRPGRFFSAPGAAPNAATRIEAAGILQQLLKTLNAPPL
jgi:hypothetical protein